MLLTQIPSPKKNKTETISCRTRASAHAIGAEAAGCGFILSDDGGLSSARRCGAPIMPGSAYCRHHHERCAVSPGTIRGRDAIRDLEREAARASAVPEEFGYLATVPMPELDGAAEPDDIAACLDIGLPGVRGDE